jgi:hypothetical protein
MDRFGRPAFAWRPVLAVAVAELAVLIATASRYGYHRDELYFLQAGRHTAFGYDDQPPLTPLIGRASTALFGDSVRGLRVLPALAIALCVVLTALIARNLGGGRRAQLTASACLAASTILFAGHQLSTATFDILAWAALLWLVSLILAGGDPRLWLAAGAIAGLGLENKHLALLLLGSLAVAGVVTRRRDLLRGPWPRLGGALALALWAPNLIWQARHGWPQLDLAGDISSEDPTAFRAGLLPFQLVVISPFLAPVWIAGLLWLLRADEARRFRMLGAGYLVLLAACLLVAARWYYPAGWYAALLAAGGVALERWLDSRAHRAVLVAAVAASAAVAAVVSLPVVPERNLHSTPVTDVNEDVGEMVGWPRFVDALARVHDALPPSDRARAVIFTANYGEAGAVARFGPARGLPTAYSGHNAYWRFGRPPDGARPVIVVGFEDPGYLARFFTGCRQVARFDNGLEVDNDEQDGPIWLCLGTREPWRQLWPRLRHLDA